MKQDFMYKLKTLLAFVSYILTISNDKRFNIYSNKYISLIMSFVLLGIGTFILISSLNEYF